MALEERAAHERHEGPQDVAEDGTEEDEEEEERFWEEVVRIVGP